MRRSLLAAALLSATLAACNGQGPSAPATGDASSATAAASEADAKFADLSKRALAGWLQLHPVAATQIGEHRYDAEVDDLSAAGRQKIIDFTNKMLAELDGIDATRLSRENQIDALLLRNQLKSDLWGVQTYRSWAWDPQDYSSLAGGAIYNLMAREFAPMPQRLKSATARMQKIPQIFAQMR
ncbi:MAG TPA: DUF885 family protein, partial [Lysobacter sp.]|nr:DUF885 family protein [Lysobacter sp.]